MCKSLLSMVALNIKCDKLWRRTLVRRLAQLVAKTFSQGVIYEGCLAASLPPLQKLNQLARFPRDSYFVIFITVAAAPGTYSAADARLPHCVIY
jgi:hypothetical protein